MLISQEVTGVSAEFTLERTGDQVTATLHYGLTGYYNEELGYYEWNGEIGADIGEDNAYLFDDFDRPMDISFTATLVAGVAEAGSYFVNDWIGGPQFTHSFTVAVFDAAANYAGSDVADYVFGSAANDRISGGLGNDNFAGGNGNDTLRGDAGDDALQGGLGIDVIGGGDGNDRLNGGGGIDLMTGGNGNDRLVGGFGQDLLSGGAGTDTINGDTGADTIDGGGGGDRLFGGAGHDRFYYDLASDSANTAYGHDVIRGFKVGEDKIDLHDIDAMAGTEGNQDFTFIGDTAFTAEGQVRFLRAGGDGYILINTIGPGGADMAIQLSGVIGIGEASFIL
ncbi:hypothetical protein BH10PSE7_BH10PSE7_23640 [soil metagenome]